jgi:hypothetical protein
MEGPGFLPNKAVLCLKLVQQLSFDINNTQEGDHLCCDRIRKSDKETVRR